MSPAEIKSRVEALEEAVAVLHLVYVMFGSRYNARGGRT
jgi:hypothetical protein